MRCNARCDFCDYWKNGRGRDAQRCGELRGRGALLQSGDDHVHWRRAAAAARSRGDLVAVGGAARCALKYLALITHGGMLTRRARALALGWRGSISSTSRSTISMSDTMRRAASRVLPRRSSTPCRACARSASTAFASTPSSRTTNLDQLLPHRAVAPQALGMRRERSASYTDAKNGNRRTSYRATSSGISRTSIARAARLQAAPARRDHRAPTHYLEQVPRLCAAARCTSSCSSGRAHDSHRPDGARAALPRFSSRLPLARLQALRRPSTATRALRLPRRSAGAAHARARARRDGRPHAIA